MGRAMDQVLLQEAVDLARKLWHAYIIEPSDESVQFIVDTMDPQNLSLIGTGKHELYVNLEAFFAGLERDQEEAQDITFEILDEYYEPRAIGEDTCIVFGTLWARERPDRPKPLLVEMDTRFTLVFRREGDRWLLVHLHHSTPNVDQRREEYYPKTATEQANAALEYSKAMERRAELDSMTELLNHAAFEKYVAAALVEGGEGSAFFMIDLDNFKTVNDTLGHPEGDRVIQEFADVLLRVFPRCAGRAHGRRRVRRVLYLPAFGRGSPMQSVRAYRGMGIAFCFACRRAGMFGGHRARCARRDVLRPLPRRRLRSVRQQGQRKRLLQLVIAVGAVSHDSRCRTALRAGSSCCSGQKS